MPYQDVPHLHFMGQPLVNSIFLTHVTAGGMVLISESLKNGAARHDEISAMSLKMVSSFIIEQLLTYVI